jgi:hypothetical protein
MVGFGLLQFFLMFSLILLNPRVDKLQRIKIGEDQPLD